MNNVVLQEVLLVVYLFLILLVLLLLLFIVNIFVVLSAVQSDRNKIISTLFVILRIAIHNHHEIVMV